MTTENNEAKVESQVGGTASRKGSFSQQSQASDDSQTAAEFIRSQELLEADAREALPYSIESCTKILGPLRQNVFACLTCNPPPSEPNGPWTPAGVCYACSVQCHGEHNLVEIFQKRNFTCDCGTTRVPSTSPCALRTNEETNTRGGVHSEEPDANNKYNQNFRNRFCACECDYDPFEQKGTMFQCLGLGTEETGGCGEDWYHPGCLVGMGPKWFEKLKANGDAPAKTQSNGNGLATIAEDGDDKNDTSAVVDEEDEPPMPPGFPNEDDFEGLICYKCVESNPWIKKYADTSCFLPAVMLDQSQDTKEQTSTEETVNEQPSTKDTVKEQTTSEEPVKEEPVQETNSKKRKADDDEETEVKRIKSTTEITPSDAPDSLPTQPLGCKLPNLPTPPPGRFSLFFKDGFRDSLCKCSPCHRILNSHPQLLEEEEVYEPPLSEDGASQHGGSTNGSGSLLERGESALRNVDRVRAIEGVMAYNHLKEQLKPFFQQFAESGQAIGAEDIKAYFAKLRGDEQDIKEAGEAAASNGDRKDGENGRHEQSGY